MGRLKRAGKSGAIDVAESQAVAKNQLAVLVDIVRQLVGNPKGWPPNRRVAQLSQPA